jgi:multiple antibiotic resistance protein
MWTFALALLVVANPIGQAPLFLSFIKDFDFTTQRRIMVRELIASFLIAVFFAFLGEKFLHAIQVETYAVGMCGGVVLFLVALGMIFPKNEVGAEGAVALKKEPYIVPIATPLLTGPCVLTTIILIAGQADGMAIVLGAICLAWVMIAAVLLLTPYLQFVLGKSGLTAVEQFMGMLLMILSTQSFLQGVADYAQAIHGGMQ